MTRKSKRRGRVAFFGPAATKHAEKRRPWARLFPRFLPLDNWQSLPIVSGLVNVFRCSLHGKRSAGLALGGGLSTRLSPRVEQLEDRRLLSVSLYVQHPGAPSVPAATPLTRRRIIRAIGMCSRTTTATAFWTRVIPSCGMRHGERARRADVGCQRIRDDPERHQRSRRRHDQRGGRRVCRAIGDYQAVDPGGRWREHGDPIAGEPDAILHDFRGEQANRLRA